LSSYTRLKKYWENAHDKEGGLKRGKKGKSRKYPREKRILNMDLGSKGIFEE